MSSVYDSRFGSISIPAQLSLTYLALGAWVEGFPLQPATRCDSCRTGDTEPVPSDSWLGSAVTPFTASVPTRDFDFSLRTGVGLNPHRDSTCGRLLLLPAVTSGWKSLALTSSGFQITLCFGNKLTY